MKPRACRLLACGALLLAPLASLYAWEPSGKDLDAAIHSGDFSGYFANISAWLNQKAPANACLLYTSDAADE